jgi:hypothetical protein
MQGIKIATALGAAARNIADLGCLRAKSSSERP